MAFFDRFRVELGKYEDGVHDVGEPVDAAKLKGLPAQLADFYRSWNGVRLFADTIVIDPIGSERLGEWPEGTLELDSDGRVRSRDEEGAIVVGSTLEKFLATVMAREGLLVERDGEFKDVFEEDDVEPRVHEKQTRVALKIDPDAAAWHLEAAERAFDEGDDAAAEAALARAGEPAALRRAVAAFAERYVHRDRCPADDLLDHAATSTLPEDFDGQHAQA